MLTRVAAVALLSLPLAVFAQPNPQPFFNVVTLEASATSEVASDTLTVTLFTEEQGPDPAQLAARANTRLEQALATAKSETGVEAHSGTYQTTPLYDRASQITGWRLRAELVLEGRDFKTVSALAGKLQPAMKLAGMSFTLSRSAREKAEASLLSDALRKFQAKADAIAKTLGFPVTHSGRSPCAARAGRAADCVPLDGRRANGRGRRTATADGRRKKRGDGRSIRLRRARSGEIALHREVSLPFVG
jgi:predicted secreted protein